MLRKLLVLATSRTRAQCKLVSGHERGHAILDGCVGLGVSKVDATTQVTTTSTSWQTALTLSSIPAGTYLVLADATVSTSHASAQINIALFVDDGDRAAPKVLLWEHRPTDRHVNHVHAHRYLAGG